VSKSLWTHAGTPLPLGKQLGKGGEGSVFELPSVPHLVAKLYHEAPTKQKQEKLRFMAAHAEKDLLSYSAWPIDTIHASPGGPLVGFVMEKVKDKQPIHMLYSPAHRKQDYPKAAWDFLLFAARNTAAAFEVVHRHGHVLGDVNQGNVMVGRDSKVLLIDSDSMQINASGKMHLCEVGVSHFTPPELQGVSSFSTIARTANHDAFGLALLIFHLLFGGRHPFAGRPLRDEVGNGLEPDIKAFRFAYGYDATQRGFAAPPHSIALSVVPSSTQVMFHRAFTEVGAKPNGRPTASDWLGELDRVRSTLKSCGKSRIHVYPNHQGDCPWCKLESTGAYFFIDLIQVTTGPASTFVLARVWAAIESIQPPRPATAPNPTAFRHTATPLPEGVKKQKNRIVSFLVAIVIIGALSVAFPQIALLWLIGGMLSWWTMSGSENKSYSAEKQKRAAAYATAGQTYQRLVAQLTQTTSNDRFQEAKQALLAAKHSHNQLQQLEATEIASVQAKARERQLNEFLERFFLDDASISGLGPAKKAALRSFGIETAADLSPQRIAAVKGFGPKLTATLMSWKNQKEKSFHFNGSPQALQADIARVQSQIAGQRQKIEGILQGGPERLLKVKTETEAAIARMMQQLNRAAADLAQATVDVLP
jgi:DNA-binding helix-hairpin-helix protein with protein kinase domain